MNTDRKNRWATFGAPLGLIGLSTVIAEVLIGSTPVSRIQTLPFQFLYYGSAALVIREVVVRRQLQRVALLVFGLAFGICTEGLALQSVFNPHFLNLDISFGRHAEVNWPWTLYMVGYHALWSITIPITLAELIWHDRREVPWTSPRVAIAFFVIFALVALALNAVFRKQFQFVAPVVPYAVAAAVMLGLIAVAVRLKRRPGAPATRPAQALGLAIFGFGAVWFLLYGDIFKRAHLFPAWLNLGVGIGAAAILIVLTCRFFPGAWPARHRFALAAGGLAASSLFGIFVVASSGAPIDVYAQCGLIATGAFLLVLLWRNRVAAGDRPVSGS